MAQWNFTVDNENPGEVKLQEEKAVAASVANICMQTSGLTSCLDPYIYKWSILKIFWVFDFLKIKLFVFVFVLW